MNSRNLINLALLVLLLLGVFLINNNNEPVKTQRLTALNIDRINEIEIPRTQGNSILFHKNESSIWTMDKPYNIKAHPFRINTLLGLTQIPVDKTYDTRELELSQYALAPPRASIKFNNTVVNFGKTNPVNNLRYFQVNNKLALVSEQLYPLVSAQAASFIDLSLLPDNFNINKIETPQASIQRDNNGQWQSTGTPPLSADQIQNLLQNWRSTQAFAVHKYLERKQLGKIKIYDKSRNITFTISDTDPWLILARPDTGIEYHLDKSQKDRLLFGYTPEGTDDA
ncbi:hypothetical protein MNBD_GAMMA09-1656 [hydrothermal vent metagenome]|uniref:DUF4340 domain-containing protein n=1 Tax=hydrothermal vent metagenome TaxID=652676 RepID=A0A3B0Y171_9ZZZZ